MNSNTKNPLVTIMDLDIRAVEGYSECPKYITIVRHADLDDDSEFHCVRRFVGPLPKGVSYLVRNFTVPGQDVIWVEDKKYGLFSVISVLEKEQGQCFWLVTSVVSRKGFLLHADALPQSLLPEGITA